MPESSIPDERIPEERFKASIQARSQELELFWKRSLFFWGLIASTFVGYAATIDKKGPVSLTLACFGFICSLAWTLANRGSKFWQENWEQKVAATEGPVVGELFRSQEPRQKKGPFSGYRFSVSRLAIALSDFAAIVWASMLAAEGVKAFGISAIQQIGPRTTFGAYLGVTILFAAVMVWNTLPERLDKTTARLKESTLPESRPEVPLVVPEPVVHSEKR